MKPFLLKLFLLTITIFLLQYVLGIWLHFHRNMLVEETYYPVKRWKEFYAMPENSIDLLFLGSSHCYRSFVPSIFDSLLNINSFNLGSSGQSISTSYYVLKESLNTQRPKTIMLEISHSTIGTQNPYINVFHNFPQMKSGIRYQMLTTVPFNRAVVLATFPLKSVSINRDQLMLNKKQYPNTNAILYSLYDHKGYVATHAKDEFKYENLSGSIVKLPSINEIQYDHLKKIINLCNNENIELIVITQPMHPQYWSNFIDYKTYEKLDSLFFNENIPYYNFNQISPLPKSFFYDHGHLIHEGAIQFSYDVINHTKKQKHF